MIHLPVLSISRPAWEALEPLPKNARIIGLFHRSINLLLGEQVIALVTPQLQNGPFHIVLKYLPPHPPQGKFTVAKDQEGISMGDWYLEMNAPLVWEPKPNWEEHSISRKQISSLRALLIEKRQRSKGDSPFADVAHGEIPPSLHLLKEGICAWDDNKINLAVKAIAGLGPGLTPAGDDFLAGLLLAIHLHFSGNVSMMRLCSILFQTAAGATTTLSRAFLQAACDGLADERWHIFFQALKQKDEPN